MEKQYAKAGTHHPSFSISIRQCLITQKKKKSYFIWVHNNATVGEGAGDVGMYHYTFSDKS